MLFKCEVKKMMSDYELCESSNEKILQATRCG